MKVERFEDLICWQKARSLTNAVYDLTRLPSFGKDFELIRQMRAAAVSCMSNVAEGFDRWSRKELVRFLDIAKGSAVKFAASCTSPWISDTSRQLNSN